MATEVIKTTDPLVILKDHQLRVTPQRHLILEYLMTHHNHPTVETIRQALGTKLPNLGVATVYNTLNTLVNIGVVLELQNGDGSAHYDYFGTPHYHVICTNCGRITDVTYPGFSEDEKKIEAKAGAASGYLISGNHMEVYGLCPDCQQKLRLHQTFNQK